MNNNILLILYQYILFMIFPNMYEIKIIKRINSSESFIEYLSDNDDI